MIVSLQRCDICRVECAFDSTDAHPCACGGTMRWVHNSYGEDEGPRTVMPVDKNKPFKIQDKHKATCSRRSAEEQERLDTERYAATHKAAMERNHEEKLSGKDSGPMRLDGSVPTHEFYARIRESGDPHYWQHEGVKALKRAGRYFGRR